MASPVKVHRSAFSIVISGIMRTLVFTITCTGLGMAFGLFGGIMVQVIRSLIHPKMAIDMSLAYRYGAFPLAAICGIGGLIVFAFLETQTARRLLAAR